MVAIRRSEYFFFHHAAQTRNSKNAIRMICNEAREVKIEVQEIKEEAVSYFKKFLQNNTSQIGIVENDLDNLLEYRCSGELAVHLARPVTEEKIKQVLHSMPSGKTPGPDGYTKEFFIATWSVVGSDFVTAVQSFFHKGFMPSGVNATILTLIPKRIDAQMMKDFKPITCCNTIYKVI